MNIVCDDEKQNKLFLFCNIYFKISDYMVLLKWEGINRFCIVWKQDTAEHSLIVMTILKQWLNKQIRKIA